MNIVENESYGGKSSDKVSDPVNHPQHYERLRVCIEPIDLCEAYNFNVGNAIKYILRAGHKEGEDRKTDLEKARWYLIREFKRSESSTNTLLYPKDMAAAARAALLLYSQLNRYIKVLFDPFVAEVTVDKLGTYSSNSLLRAAGLIEEELEPKKEAPNTECAEDPRQEHRE